MQTTVRLNGRVLWLSDSAEAMTRQLAGENLVRADAGTLRDQISTDEMTPAWACLTFDETLGDYVYVGLRCSAIDGDPAGVFPVTPKAVRSGGFALSVSGMRRGKGSSREASPFAEWCAGIRIVVADSFERIYAQNCQNLGLLMSTDQHVVERLLAGEDVPVEAFLEDCDSLGEAIVRSGGLFGYTRRRLAAEVVPPRPAHAPGPMTYGEKIIARALGVPRVRAGDAVFVPADWRFSHEYVTPMAVSFLHHAFDTVGETAGDTNDVADAMPPLHDPASILCFEDHLTHLDATTGSGRPPALIEAAHQLGAVQREFCARHGLRLHGRIPGGGSEGICHAVMLERYALPGQVVVGTDSHTPHCGAIGAFAFGVGATEMANAWLTGDARLAMPGTCLVQLRAKLPAGVSAKDLALHVLHLPYIRDGRAIGQIIEFAGEAVAHLSTDERATLTNMVAEIGGLTGIVVPDAETVRYLQERRGVQMTLEPWMTNDAQASYAHVIEIDCTRVGAMVASPGDPGNGVALASLAAPVRIDIAYGGSCTGSKRDDLRACHDVLAWGLSRGMHVADGVRFYLQYGSEDVRAWCESQGYTRVFEAAGVTLLAPGCGACVNAGPGASSCASDVVISAQNRNFPGRSGPGQMWLGSPATVAASALAGYIVSFDQLQRDARGVPPSRLASNHAAGGHLPAR
ncbi:2,3-dimethylmalate dehydratase large subunit [Pandoraea pneumonica]|uniref:2,3-dimethylmalate dehydratase large subunit n=1 Tax=Pandoraea pneumonica TaxID=2508299 RepID=A0A5E4TUC7_9BURK|nr:aconitase family protein [Pandoraea pneumonica]VVD89549.1 2,3-dimethylmalate dehydratase large subunit [Pandoraea pneumonica]